MLVSFIGCGCLNRCVVTIGEFVELDFRLEFGMNGVLVEVEWIHRIFGRGLEGHLHRRR